MQRPTMRPRPSAATSSPPLTWTCAPSPQQKRPSRPPNKTRTSPAPSTKPFSSPTPNQSPRLTDPSTARYHVYCSTPTASDQSSVISDQSQQPNYPTTQQR